MWPEPLAARVIPTDRYRVEVVVENAEGWTVAAVSCAYNEAAGWGSFGEMRITAAAGAPKQRVRALVMLVREALRYADAIGIRHVRTEASPRYAAFAARMCGFDGGPPARRHIFSGHLHAARTAALSASRPDGSWRGLSDDEEREIDGAINVRG